MATSSNIGQEFNWSQNINSGSNSFIPDNLKDFNQTTSFSIETPSGLPTELIPNPPQIDNLQNQLSGQLPLQTGSNLLASQTGLISNSTPDLPSPPQIESATDLKTPESTNQLQTNLPRINSFFEPKIVPENISINLESLTRSDQEQMRENLGFAPFIWYNNIQIDYKDIESFVLKYENNIPTIKMFFRDSLGIMKQVGFPGDDTIITVFFNSRSKNLRSIKADFKILSFNDFGDGSFSISGVINIPRLYTRKFESFNSKTSHQTLQEVAKNLDLGFCSNLSDTGDSMTWINPGKTSLEFITDILTNSYVSDDSFLFFYIDFYYNICYVDLNKELTRYINEDVMVNSMGFDKVKLQGAQAEESLIPLIISNDNSFESTNGFISEYTILNKSTKISIQNSYKTLSKVWNVEKKEFLLFDIETITPDGEKEIILKGRPDDSTYFRENVNSIWLGKLETDNSHINFAYSIIQNSKNLDEITKIGAVLTLSTPNLNLYLFQKIKVMFSAKKLTPTHEEQFFKRLSGDWLIVGLEIKFNGSKVYQVLNVIKTTLSMTPEESQKSVAPKDRKETEVAEKNTNQLVEAENVPESGEGGSPITTPNTNNCGGPGTKNDVKMKVEECQNCLGEQFTNLVQGFATPASFAGQKIATVQELEKLPIRPNEDVQAEILPIINSPEYLSKYTKGHRMFALVWTMKEGYNGPRSGKSISRSYRTKNPGNIGNTDSGDNKSFNTIKEGLDFLMKFLKDVSIGQGSNSYKFGPKTIKPTWSNEIANNPKAYGRYLNDDKTKPIGCLPGYTGNYQGQLGAFTMIYSTFSRVSNGSIAKLSAIFGINGYKKKIDGNTLLSELITFNDPSPINFDFKK